MIMKWFGMVLAALIMVCGPEVAGAFSQADVDRMLAGDKNMQNADLSSIGQINLNVRTYNNVDFSRANFSGSRMWGLVFDNAKLEGAKLDNGSFKGSHFHLVNFRGASLVNADLSNVPAGGADFTTANLSGAKLTNSRLQTCKLIQANLSGADLTDGSLFRADLTGAKLDRVKFTNVDMDSAKINVRWKSYIQGQNTRNFDKIQWVQPTPVQPKDLKSQAAGKVKRAPVKPTLPFKN